MDKPTDAELEQRLLEQRLKALTRAVEQPTPSPPTRNSKRHGSIGAGSIRVTVAACMGMALTLLIGIQLGALPWRYRRELWRSQGLIVGLVIGFAAGRLTGRGSDRP